MSVNNSNQNFIGVQYGTITGVITSAWMIYNFSTHSNFFVSSKVITLLLTPISLFLGILLTIYNFRKQTSSNKLSFIDAFKIGLQSALVYTLLTTITTFFCQTILYPEYSIDAIADTKAQGIALKIDPKIISDRLLKIEEELKIKTQITTTLFGGLFGGTIFSIFCAAFMRRQ